MPTDVVTLTTEARAAIDALNALPTEQHADVLKALQNDGGAVVRTFRTRVFGGGKEEGKKAAGAATEQLTQRDERIAELESQNADLTGKIPDAEKLKADMTKAWEKKVEAERVRAERAEQALTKEHGTSFTAQLVKAARDLDVDKEYDDVLTTRYSNRLRILPDGTRQVLKPGEDAPYEADSFEEAVKLLAADVRKTVPAKFVLSHAESGGGVMNGAGGGGRVSPAKVEQERLQQARAGVQGAF